MRDLPILLLTFGVSLGLTLVLEFGIALLWRVRRKALLLVLLVNVLTNPAVVYLHLLLSSLFPSVLPLWQIPLELCAIAIEGACYARLSDIKHPWRLSLLANLCSYTCGILINIIL